jgi:hypothetical protein
MRQLAVATSYIHFYIHFALFAANRSWPPVAAHPDCGLVSAKNRTYANDTDHPQTPQPRTHKPLVAGSNPAAATKIPIVQAKKEGLPSRKKLG